MKNTSKKFLAIVLSMFFILSGTSAFATDKTVEWHSSPLGAESEEWITVPYLGEISETTVEVGKDEPYSYETSCFGITAEKSGYYYFNATLPNNIYYDVIYVPETYSDGKAYGIADYEMYFGGEAELSYIYYLPEGETVVFINSIGKINVSCEFLGEKVTDVDYDKNTLSGIVDYDFWGGSYSAMIGGVNGNIYFSSGKVLEFEDMILDFETDEKIKKGENKTKAICFGIEKEITVMGYEATDFISSIEAVDFEDDLAVSIAYNGDIQESAYDIEAKIVVNYTDGTSETLDFNDGYTTVILPNGREYSIQIIYDTDEMVAELIFADHVYKTYGIEAVSVSFNENLNLLKNDCEYWINRANNELHYRIDRLGQTESFGEKLSLIFWIPGVYSNALFQIFCNVFEFAEYYAAI